MSTEKLSTEIRKEQIASAALEVLGRHGISGLNMADIARRVGLVPSAIYRHFRSKDELLDAVLELIGQKLMKNIELSRERKTNCLGCLRSLLMRHAELVQENQGILRLLFSDEIANGKSDRRSKAYGMIRSFLAEVAAIVREGQKRGEIRDDWDANTVALLWVGLVQPAAVLWHVSGRQFDVTTHAERAWRLFRAAVSVPSK
jgi:AcrR family transcriptional regulator